MMRKTLSYLAPRIGNILLRGFSMGSRLVLLVVLARFMSPADVGFYGLFTATLVFSVLVIGGDYYTYSQRELLSRPQPEWSFVLQHQLLGTLLLYGLLVPLQWLFFAFDLLPHEWMLWFFVILLVEHLAQEINRLLVAMQRPLLASWVLFVRMGLWVWPLLAIMWTDPTTRHLESVFMAWFAGSLLSVLIGLAIVVKSAAPWRRWPIDVSWILKGYRVGLLFLIATMSFRALQTFDRYVVEHLAGPDLLGVYVFYTGLAMAVIGFLDPAVFSFLYPRLVRAYRQGQRAEYQRVLKELAWSATLLSALMAVTVGVLAPVIFNWTGQAIYQERLDLLWLLLSMVVLYAIGMVPHYGLYARGADSVIVTAHVGSLIVFITTVWLTAPSMPVEAAAFGVLAAFAWMGLYKYLHYRRLVRREEQPVIELAPAQGH